MSSVKSSTAYEGASSCITWKMTLSRSMSRVWRTQEYHRVSHHTHHVRSNPPLTHTHYHTHTGTLIRRHRIPLPSPHDDSYYTMDDFNVGKKVVLHGRTFQITVSVTTSLTSSVIGMLLYVYALWISVGPTPKYAIISWGGFIHSRDIGLFTFLLIPA